MSEELKQLESILDAVCGVGGGMPVDEPIYTISLTEIAEAFQRLKAGQGEAVAPYGYLREVDGNVQLSVGPARPADRSGGCATPWAAIFAAPPTSSDAVSVPAAMPERWEDRLSRMHQTIQAGCWPKRWVDDAKDYELGELRALLARQEAK